MLGLKIGRVVFVNLMNSVFVLLLPKQNVPPKELSDGPTGAELYARNCAVCHRNGLPRNSSLSR
jgi:mono/diheme cytochrome c family protein